MPTSLFCLFHRFQGEIYHQKSVMLPVKQRALDARVVWCSLLLDISPKLGYSMDNSVVHSAGRYLFFPSRTYVLLVRQQKKILFGADFCLLQLFPRYKSAGELCQPFGLGIIFALLCAAFSLPTQHLASILLYSLHSFLFSVWLCFGHVICVLSPFYSPSAFISGNARRYWVCIHDFMYKVLNGNIFIIFASTNYN